MKALRNARCFLCQRKVPDYQTVEAGAGAGGMVKVRVCKRCSVNPEAGIKERQVAQEKAARRKA